MQFQKKIPKRLLSFVTALTTGISAAGITSTFQIGGVFASAEDAHSYDENGFCTTHSDGTCDAPYESTTQNEDGTYEISNAGQLYWFAAYVNTYDYDNATYPNVAANAVLTADITVNEGDVAGCDGTKAEGWRDWTPIAPNTATYAGKFDGQGHTISGLYFNNEDTDTGKYVGLFGHMENGGEIQNVGLKNSYFRGSNYIGGICGSNYRTGTIRNCYSEANLTGVVVANKSGFDIGGVVGENDGTIENCYSTGNVTGNECVGGVVGANNTGSIINSYTTGKAIGKSDVGDVCGQNNGGTLTNCYYIADSDTDNNDGTFGKTAEQFASGEVAYLLNGSESTDVTFCQNLDNGEPTDASPVLDSTHGTVYQFTNCNQADTYTNNKDAKSGDHSWDENGFCRYNDSHYQPATQNTDGTYEIANAGQLYWFAGLVNGTLTDGTAKNNKANAVLTSDIVVNEGTFSVDAENKNYDVVYTVNGATSTAYREWTPIGYGTWFMGNFDGQGHTVSGLYIKDEWTKSTSCGFIGRMTKTVKNLTISNSFFYAYYCAGIAGLNNGSIERCTNNAYVSGIYAGGIQGCSIGFDATENPTVSKCVNNGVIFGYNYELGVLSGKVGGITGTVYDEDNLGITENCINFGHVYGRDVGGIIGEVTAANYQVKNCYNVGECTTYWYYKNLYPNQTSEWENVGPIAGEYKNLGSIFQNCYYESTDADNDGVADEIDEIDNTSARTQAQFNSGSVCVELNTGAGLTEEDEPIFYQNLTTEGGTTIDPYPVLDDTHGKVYKKQDCGGVFIGYTNDKDEAIAQHDWDENGFCKTYPDSHFEEPKLVDGVYQIENAGQLYWFAELVNTEENGIYPNTSANAVLTKDIVVNENVLNEDGTLNTSGTFRAWTPIGADHSAEYEGKFDGQNHTISGLYYNNNYYYAGLFSYVDSGTISNVGVVDSYLKSSMSGGICGWNEGTIENCYNSGRIYGKDNGGGICGYSQGTIKNCYNTGTIEGGRDGSILLFGVGGICGYNNGTIENCHSIGNIENAVGSIGGLCALNYKVIRNCYFNSDIYTGNRIGYESSVGTIENVEGKTTAEFASGEVCYLLNGDQSAIAFYQDLSAEKYPTLNADSEQVCRLEMTYDESFGEDAATVTTYHNTGAKITLEKSPDNAYTYHYYVGETEITESPYTLTADTEIIVKKVPVEIQLSEGIGDTIELTYHKKMDALDLNDFVMNLDVLESVAFQVDAAGALPEGLTLTAAGVLSGTPEKAADEVKTTLILTAKNGASKKAELTFHIAKADPTVEVTVDGDKHTEGDLVDELGLILSENSTKGTVKIVGEIKRLAAGKNTLTWEFTPADSDNYNVVTGTVIVNAQATTTTTVTTTKATTVTTSGTTSTTKATTATTSGTTSATKASITTGGTNSATKASVTTSGTTSMTKASITTSGTTSMTKASITTSGTTSTTKASTTTNETTSTTKVSTTTSGTTSATKASVTTSGTTSATKATTVTTSGTISTTKASITTSGTTSTTKASTTTNETTSTTKVSTTTSGTTSATKASITTSGTTSTTKASTTASGTTSTTKASTTASGTTSTTKVSATTSGTTSTTKASATTSGTTSTTKASTATNGTTSTTKASTATNGTTSTTKASTTTSGTTSATTTATTSATATTTTTVTTFVATASATTTSTTTTSATSTTTTTTTTSSETTTTTSTTSATTVTTETETSTSTSSSDTPEGQISVTILTEPIYCTAEDSASFDPASFMRVSLVNAAGETVDVTADVTLEYDSPAALFAARNTAYVAENLKATYTAENGEVYEITGPMVYIGKKGDANLDGKVDSTDIYELMRYIAYVGAGFSDTKLLETAPDAADENLSVLAYFLADTDTESTEGKNTAEKRLDPQDMFYVMYYVANRGAGVHVTWSDIIR